MNMQQWLDANQWVQWVFSGIGVAALSGVIGCFLRRKKPESTATPQPSVSMSASGTGHTQINAPNSTITLNQPPDKKKVPST